MDNVDPVQFGNLLDVIGPQLRKRQFNVISKSGETAETASEFLIVRDLLAKKLGAKGLSRQVLVTTDPETGATREMADAASRQSTKVLILQARSTRLGPQPRPAAARPRPAS